jgi:hypothetical protein
MKRKAFELSSSDDSEVDGSNVYAEHEGASSRESPRTPERGIGDVRDRVEEREHGDLGRLISQNDVLRNLADRNRAVIASRRLTFCGRAQRVRATRASGRDTSHSALSLRQRWRLYLSMLDPQFFAESTVQGEISATGGAESTQERSLGGRGENLPLYRSRQSSQIYAALRMNEENNEDIAEIFKKQWAAKAIRGQPLNSYAQFRVCVGQLARFCATLKLVKVEDICERGSILRLVCELEIVQGFVGFWQARAVSSTVYSKVTQLKALVHEAWTFFSRTGDDVRRSKTRDVHEYVLSVATAEKTESRRLASGRRDVNVRALDGKLFLPRDFAHCIDNASGKLSGIMDSARSTLGARGRSGLFAEFRRCPDLVRKWNINFMALLLLTAGGQRSQVFGQLRSPDELTLAEMRRVLASGSASAHSATLPRCERDRFFALGVVLEKRVRNARMPDVLFPSLTFPFVEFHCKYVRPAICEKVHENGFDAASGGNRDAESSDGVGSEIGVAQNTHSFAPQDLDDEETLLLHTETGLPLTASHVRSTWKRFLCSIDPELSQVTPMVLRASFGTYMIHQYRTGAHFRGLNEQEFFDRLAAMMNTSSDMLANVYGACDLDDYRATANEMMRVYENQPRDDPEEQGVDAPDLNPDTIELVHGRTFPNAERHRTSSSRPMGRVGSHTRRGRGNVGLGHRGLENRRTYVEHEEDLDLT